MPKLFEEGLEAEFTFEADRSGVIEEIPFQILIMGDFAGDAERIDLADRRLYEIDRDEIDDVMAKLGTRLSLDLDGTQLDLEFKSVDDLHPDEIFRQLPIFAELRSLRKRLNDDKTFFEAAREVRQWSDVHETPSEPVATPQAEPQNDDLLGAILSNPFGGGVVAGKNRTVSKELNELLADLVKPYIVTVNQDEKQAMVAAVDTATGDLMTKILQNKRFKALEASWRGLFNLVRRVETSTQLKIYLLDVTKAELNSSLKDSDDLGQTYLFKLLAETDEDSPWAACFADMTFEPTVDDAAALIRVSRIAESANVPFVCEMSPMVLGVDRLNEYQDHRSWKLDDTDAAKIWNAIRAQKETEYLGFTINRTLARLPFGQDTEPLETFVFEEFATHVPHDGYVWSSGIYSLATLLANTFAKYEWEMSKVLEQDIEGIPVHTFKENTETIFKPCAEILLTQAGCETLMEYGLMPLISYKNTDRIKLARWQSAADPVTALGGRWS